MGMTWAIESTGLGCRFGKRTALRDVNLAVPAGQVYGFLGPNGAGKTTTIRLILGLLRPSAGALRVFGRDLAGERIAAARGVGSLIEAPSLYDQLTGRENLEIARRLRGLPRAEIDRVLELLHLRPAADQLAARYSQGMRQRLALARALLGRPRLLVLDEPTNGFDPEGLIAFRRLLRDLVEQEGASVFFSSHLLAEIEAVADHVGILHAGRLIAQQPLAALRGAGVLDIGVDAAEGAAALLVSSGVRAEAIGPDQVRAELRDDVPGALAATNALLVAAGFAVHRFALQTATLETAYRALISSAA